jgi:hypothetical protein
MGNKKNKFVVTRAAQIAIMWVYHGAKNRATHGSRYITDGEYRGRTKSFKITQSGLLKILQKQNGLCALTGVPLTFVTKKTIEQGGAIGDPKKSSPTNVSIDRINPRFGYLPNNVQLVTNYANKAKGEMQTEEFVKLCRMVVEKFEYQ